MAIKGQRGQTKCEELSLEFRWAPWVLDNENEALALIEAAYNSGINFFDVWIEKGKKKIHC